MGTPLPPALPGAGFVLDDPRTGILRCYGGDGPTEGTPLLLIHSVNAAASAFEVRPLFEHYRTRRPTYALDLPGFGLSDRSSRRYTPRLMTDAIHAIVAEIRGRHGLGDGAKKIDAMALSLGCEFLARMAVEDNHDSLRTLTLVSPTGLDGRRRHDGPGGSTRAVPLLHGIVSWSLWDDAIFNNLTRPKVIRYFLEKTWGSKSIDEAMWAYDVLTAKQDGAKNAPLYFVAGHLFSADMSHVYRAIRGPVWMCHGVRGDFVDYRGAEAFRDLPNWSLSTFETGAMPYFESLDTFVTAYEAFLARADGKAVTSGTS